VKTGGYSSRVRSRHRRRRSTAVTKSGTNDFMFAVHGNYAPDALREDRQTPICSRSTRASSKKNIVFEAGGPIIKDRLFALRP
jgi:hypothetical protein